MAPLIDVCITNIQVCMHAYNYLVHQSINACNPCYSFVSEGDYDKFALELHMSASILLYSSCVQKP